MNVRAKFECVQVSKYPGLETVKFTAVTSEGAGENASWSKYTPSGELEMGITNEHVHGAFIPGKCYYLDLSPVPEDASAEA